MNAIVTGGCSGLGLSFTKYLAARGYTVYALYNTSDISFDDEKIIPIHCDIANEKEVKEVCEKFDNIDLLINNAGIAIDNDYIKKSKIEFMHVLEVNLVGTFLITKYLFNKVNKAIINISSNNTIDNFSPLSMDYDASKAGVNMLTKDFALLNDKIKIISICPGWINTESILNMNQNYLKEEMNKVGQKKLLDKEELAKHIIDNLDNYQSGEIVEIKEL